jgi:DHA2 family methylenomycin A resistance protein-like MFS transporter
MPSTTPLTGKHGREGSRTAASTAERVALAAASLGFAVVQLDVSVVNVAVRSIGADLGTGIGGLQWVVDAYTVAFAALILTGGALGDRFGATRVLVTGFGLFTLASVACGLAPTTGTLIAFRAVQGVGAAALGACSLALISRTFPDRVKRAKALGTWAVSGSVAMAAGPLIGGLLIAAAGWRTIFFINVPVGIAGWWLTRRCTDEPDHGGHADEPARGEPARSGPTRGEPARGEPAGALDLPGQVTAALALAALAGATIEAGTYGLSPLVSGGYVLAVISGLAFVVIERRTGHPMLPLPLLRRRTFSAAIAIGCTLNVAMYGLIFVVSLFLQRAEGLSPLAAGAALLPFMGGIMAGNAASARLVHARGARAVIGLGGVIIVVGCAGMWLTINNHYSAERPVVLVILLMFLFMVAALGVGILMPAMTSAVLGEADASRAGIASGTLTASRQSGSVIGVAVFGTFLAAGLTRGFAISLLAAVALGALVVALSRLITR